jgi:hypothetical protein
MTATHDLAMMAIGIVAGVMLDRLVAGFLSRVIAPWLRAGLSRPARRRRLRVRRKLLKRSGAYEI